MGLFNRNKDEERTELDAAFEDEAPKPYFAGAAADNAEFPEPNSFDLGEDIPGDEEVPSDEDASVNEVGASAAEKEDSFETPDSFTEDVEDTAVVGRFGRHGSGRTSKQAKLDQMPEHQKRSRRMRRNLIIVALLLVALMAALGYFGWRLYQESLEVAQQQTTSVTTEVEVAAGTEEVTADTGSASTKKTTVPNLLGLLGKTQDEAIAALGSGATVTLDSPITDESSPMMHRLTVVLTEEPVDTKSGAPTVYLGMDSEEKVVIAGYSAATASLGYGTLSFADVVTNQHVVEKTLSEAGLQLEEGTVVLPDSNTYSTFADDGTTLVKEQCAFNGEASQSGTDYIWNSVLVYNYTAANATGNLADTVRQVYVYVSDKAASDVALEAKAAVVAEQKAAEEAAKKAEEEAAAAAASSSAAPEAADAEAAASSTAPEAEAA